MDNSIRTTSWKAISHHVFGKWPPLQKVRVDTVEALFRSPGYEQDLAGRIFGDTEEIRVVTDNDYPLPYASFDRPDAIIQQIIWLRESGPTTFAETVQWVKEQWPGFDFVLFENQVEARSIKSITHYHLLRKLAEPDLRLIRVQVFAPQTDDCRPVEGSPDRYHHQSRALVNHLLHLYQPYLTSTAYGSQRSDTIEEDTRRLHQLEITYVPESVLLGHAMSTISWRYGEEVADRHLDFNESDLTLSSHYKIELWSNGERRRYFNGLHH